MENAGTLKEFSIHSGRRTETQRNELRGCVKWAVGLEHESMLVHRHEHGLEEYAVDANKILREMARFGPIHGLSNLQHAIAVTAHRHGAEYSGRRCSGSIDLSFKTLLESVTADASELSFDGAYEQLQMIDDTLLEMANNHPFIQKVIKDEGLGPVQRPLTGMSNQLGMYQRTSGNWFTCASCGDCSMKDYTGSYHVSISLPSTPEGWIARDESILLDSDTCAQVQAEANSLRGGVAVTNTLAWLYDSSAEAVAKRQQDEWIDAHSNLASMVQWI